MFKKYLACRSGVILNVMSEPDLDAKKTKQIWVHNTTLYCNLVNKLNYLLLLSFDNHAVVLNCCLL
jgi:hypothetical protein